MRHPLEARTLARLAAHHAGDGPGQVVGFGLSNDERRGETSEFAHALFQECGQIIVDGERGTHGGIMDAGRFDIKAHQVRRLA